MQTHLDAKRNGYIRGKNIQLQAKAWRKMNCAD